MTGSLEDLYQDVILEHNKRPRSFRVLPTANRKADGYNALCGDRLTLYLVVEAGVIREACFQGSGCAISQASASLLTDDIRGKTVREAEEVIDRLQRMTSSPDEVPRPDGLGELSALAGVRQFPARIECASLSWQTLSAALDRRTSSRSDNRAVFPLTNSLFRI